MEKNTKVRWIVVAVVAAIIAAVTTLVVVALRARAKKKAWYEDAAFDYDVDDCECFDDGEDAVVAYEAEEPAEL